MTLRWAAALSLGLWLGCTWDTTEPHSSGPRGVPRRPGDDVAPTPARKAAPFTPATQAPLSPPPEEPAAEEEEKKEKERDYGAELMQTMGSPIDCLASRATTDAPQVITIELEAYVMPSGGVGRGYARSAELSSDELDCVRRRLETKRLAPPNGDEPKRVTTTIRLELKKPGNPGG